MPAACTRMERRTIYDTLVHALTVAQDDYRGHSSMLTEMALEQQRELCSSLGHFSDPEAMPTVCSGLVRDWPEARGEWKNTSGSITACINLQDHLHLQFTYGAMEGGLHRAFSTFLEAITELECSLQYHATTFAHHTTLGHLTASPSHLGAGLQINMQLRYAILTKCILFVDIMRAVGFTEGQWVEGSDHFIVSYSHHFGESEVEFLQTILKQAEELAVIESAYAKGDNIFPLLPSSVQKGSGGALANFPAFPDKTTTLAHLLDQNTYLNLVTMKTPHGFALDDALQYGRDNPQDQFWFVLGDSHTLEVYSDIFLPVIKAIHGHSPRCPSSALKGCSPALLHGARALCEHPSPGCYIIVRRNLSRFPFPSSGSPSSREAVNNAIHSTVRGFTDSLHTKVRKSPLGTFWLNSSHPVHMSGALSPPVHAILSKDWPDGRSVWVCEELQLSLISNTTEHLTLVFHRQDGDMLSMYQAFCYLYPQLERAFERLGYNFAKVDPYGFMSTRPHDFGHCTSAGVLLHAPALQGSNFVGMTQDGVSAEVLGDVVALSSSSLLSDATTHAVIQRAVNAALRTVELEKMAAVGCELPPDEDLSLVAHHPDYPDLCDGASLLARHLSPLLYTQLIDRTTSSGFTLNDVIQVGVDQEGCGTQAGPGIIAGDAECYDVFRELYQPVLLDLHSTCQIEGAKETRAPPSPAGTTVVPGHSRCITHAKAKLHCNLAGFPFPPAMSRSQRAEVERIISDALSDLPGSYHPLAELSTGLHQKMKRKGFLGSEPAYPFFVSACILRDWPQCRALWVSEKSTVAAFVNGEDHLCLTAVSGEGSVSGVCHTLQQVFTTLLTTLSSMGHQLARHEQFGLLTSSPANVGSGFHLECTVKLPLLSAHALLPDLVASCHLRLLPELDKKSGLLTIASQQSLGVTQQQVAEDVMTQVAHLCRIEATLEAGNCLYGTTHAPPSLADKLTMVVEDEFPDLTQAARPLALALDEDLFWALYSSSSVSGATLEDVISVGLQSPAHPVGVVACDADCYSVFSELYRKALSNVYPGCTWQKEHPRAGVPLPQVLLPPEVSEHIVGFTFEYRRNLSGFSFPPRCTRAERAEAERILKDLLAKQPQLKDAYVPLDHLSVSMEERPEVKAMTEPPDPATGMTRDWPANRGVCLAEGGVAVGVNIDDHLKVCLVSSELDLVAYHRQVFQLMVDLEAQLQQQSHSFAFSHQNGYLNTCPTHSGSGMRVEVKLHLPKLIRHRRLGRILQKHCFSLKSPSVAVNKVTGESESAMELCYLPGHGVSEGDTLSNLVSSLEHLCCTEATLHQKKMKWRAVPWTAI